MLTYTIEQIFTGTHNGSFRWIYLQLLQPEIRIYCEEKITFSLLCFHLTPHFINNGRKMASIKRNKRFTENQPHLFRDLPLQVKNSARESQQIKLYTQTSISKAWKKTEKDIWCFFLILLFGSFAKSGPHACAQFTLCFQLVNLSSIQELRIKRLSK